MKPTCKVLEVAGIKSAILGMRLPTQSNNDSQFDEDCYNDNHVALGSKDASLAKNLLSKGNVHGKFQRGVIAWLDITMPRYMWAEIDTYTVGVSPTSSTSTMYTLLKESLDDYDVFKQNFVDGTDEMIVCGFYSYAKSVRAKYDAKEISRSVATLKLKQALPESWCQRRIKAYSYQALKGMYHSRKFHRLPEWQVVCNAIENLPYAEELLFGMPVDEFIEQCDK